MKSLRPSRSIRTRILAIAWIPSFVLLLVGLGVSGSLAYEGLQARRFGSDLQQLVGPFSGVMAAIGEEHRLTLLKLSDPSADVSRLPEVRQRVDASLSAALESRDWLLRHAPKDLGQRTAETDGGGIQQLARLRQGVDAGQVTVEQVDQLYPAILLFYGQIMHEWAQFAPTTGLANSQLLAAEMADAAAGLARVTALAELATRRPGLDEAQYRAFVSSSGAYHHALTAQVASWPAEQQAAVQQLMGTAGWQQQQLVETAVLHARPTTTDDGSIRYAVQLPLDRNTWESANGQVGGVVNNIFSAQFASFAATAEQEGRDQLVRSLLAAALLVLLALVVFAVSTRMSSTLITRLRKLRDRTLEQANVRLPDMVERLRRGEPVDVAAELPPLAAGRDEIGQVATAFDHAQQTAVAAAAAEAETRAGAGKVFLNIARRSQVIVHRQLKLLDQAERAQDDPDQLNLLFELDHLATRARRNAENLIILGGGRPGRQWRRPVPAVQVVRSAIGESERYARVTTGELPTTPLDGAVVADVVHLLAELVDNATSFSPPTSRVEVRSNLVGRGLAIEIEDQGLGIEPEKLAELNEMLRNPPDFSMMALTSEPRLGLFVVAQLAARHGIVVTLVEAPYYGGTRALVLLPTALLAPAAEPGEADAEPVPEPAFEPAGPPTWPRGIPRVTEPVAEPVQAPPPPPPPVPAPVPALAAPATPAGGFDEVVTGVAPQAMSSGRPELPRRVRQANLVPQLLTEDPPATPAAAAPSDADRVRERFASLQRGTRRGRSGDPAAPAQQEEGERP